MGRATIPKTMVERLAHDLFDGALDDPFGDELASWLRGSRRFREFAQMHRDKIRKKLRNAPDAESRRDVRAELRTAHALLADRRIDLAFEAYGSGRTGPDFTVTFRGNRAFNLEVTRLRGAATAASLVGTVLVKLRQLPPSTPNALLVAVGGIGVEELDVAATIRQLRSRADAKDEAWFVGRGFEGSRSFYQRFMRLGAVLVEGEAAAGPDRATAWTNGSARIAVPDGALRACLDCLRGS